MRFAHIDVSNDATVVRGFSWLRRATVINRRVAVDNMPWISNSNLALHGNNPACDVFRLNLASNSTVAGLVMMARYALDRNVQGTIKQAVVHYVP